MNSYLFIGKILPERIGLNIPKMTFNKLTTLGLEEQNIGDLTVETKGGLLVVNLITPESFNLATIKNSIEFYVRVIVDSCGYVSGQALDIDFEYVSGPDGSYSFSPRINSIFNNQEDRPLTADEVLQLAVSNLHLLRAIANLREAIKHPVDVGLFCFRALENIRQHFAAVGASRPQSWVALHRALNTSQDYINESPSLTSFSEQSRHGETQVISGDDMEMILNKTWIIVDRFCVYLQQGEVGLDVEDYPRL